MIKSPISTHSPYMRPPKLEVYHIYEIEYHLLDIDKSMKAIIATKSKEKALNLLEQNVLEFGPQKNPLDKSSVKITETKSISHEEKIIRGYDWKSDVD